MPRQFTAYNAAAPTTSILAAVTTGTSLKTMLQIAPPSTLELEVVSWGISFSGSVFGTKVQCELIETDVAATVTAHGATGIIKVSDPGALGSQVTLGTTATGFTSSGEGTTAASRTFDSQFIDGSGGYSYTWSLGMYPIVAVSKFLRVRVSTSSAVNAICWVTWQE